MRSKSSPTCGRFRSDLIGVNLPQVVGDFEAQSNLPQVVAKLKGRSLVPEGNEIAIVSAETIQDKIYIIRGQQVMLDFELAEIYGYTTTRFNEQVKRNSDKFDDDFRFQLTREEWENLRSKYSTSSLAVAGYEANLMSQNAISSSELPDDASNLISNNLTSSWGGRRKLPYAFTEQGIYMLMTVLRGDLATQQSKALIRLFKQMKDYIVESRALPDGHSSLAMAVQLNENTRAIGELKAGLAETQETLSSFMAGFGEGAPFGREYLIMNGQTLEADIAYQQIYSLAKKSVFVVDNYIGVKTLLHLRHVAEGVAVTVFSDNVGKGLAKAEFADFCKEYPNVDVSLRKTGGTFHDRFVVIDHGTPDERVFLCGASSKDAGRRTTAIMESSLTGLYHEMVEGLLGNPELKLR